MSSTADGVVGAVRSAQIAASVAAPQDPEYDSLPELSALLRVDDVDKLEELSDESARYFVVKDRTSGEVIAFEHWRFTLQVSVRIGRCAVWI